MTISSVTPSSPFVSLDAFAQAAQSGQDVYVDIAGEKLQVLGMGTTPGGRSVAWVAPNVDTTAMFGQALAHSYGQGIASAVSRELGLEPNPGKPLSARTITLALDMAQTSRDALSGVDFLTRLAVSASTDTPAFQQACRDAGVAPASLDAARRGALDQAMQTRFDQAASPGRVRCRWPPPPPGCANCSSPAEARAFDGIPPLEILSGAGLLVFTYLT